jgi:hypothetical protein
MAIDRGSLLGRVKSYRAPPWPRSALLLLLGVLAACATPPVQETKQFQQAFTAVDSVGQPILDDLAMAERSQGQVIAVRRAQGKLSNASAGTSRDCNPGWHKIDGKSGYITGFCTADAGYFSKIGDPPQTLAFRRALALIGEFAQALTALSDGTSAAAASAQVQQVAQDAGSLAALVGGSVSGAGAAIGPAVNEIAAALAPLINRVATIASAQQERDVVIAAAPKVGALILALKNAAPAMFNTLTEQAQNQIELTDPPRSSDAAPIEAYRVVLSDYVVLLDRLDRAWNQLVAVVKQPPNAVSLGALTQTSSQIVADAAIVRQSLTRLRRGDTTN